MEPIAALPVVIACAPVEEPLKGAAEAHLSLSSLAEKEAVRRMMIGIAGLEGFGKGAPQAAAGRKCQQN